jgi:hypothetical protein
VGNFRSSRFAESTKRTYTQYLVSYARYCKRMNISLVPLSSVNLGRYVAYLSGHLKFGSIQNYLSIIRLLHLEAGLPNPLQSYYVNTLIKGAKRVLGNTTSKKLPITPQILHRMFACISLSNNKDIVFWAACLVAFFSFFRKSNLFPPSASAFDPNIHLSRKDIVFHSKGCTLSVRWSKTIQYKERSLHIPLPRIPGSPLCPSQALLLAFNVNKHSNPNTPAFMYASASGLVPYTYGSFLARLKQCLHGMGLDSPRYSGHSFRRGGASFALECGLSPDLIQSQGDWRSDAYKAYLDPSLQHRQQVVDTLAEAIQKTFA